MHVVMAAYLNDKIKLHVFLNFKQLFALFLSTFVSLKLAFFFFFLRFFS